MKNVKSQSMSLTFISNDTSFHAECYTIALMFIIKNKINLGLSYCLQEYICSSVLSLSLLPFYQPANLSLDKFKTIIILSQLEKYLFIMCLGKFKTGQHLLQIKRGQKTTGQN